MSEDRSYEVGYGKPPKHSRFKPGQSGNPKGRKPGSKNVMTLLEETLFDPVKVRENGKVRRVPAIQACLLNLRNQAMKGDPRAQDRFMKLVSLYHSAQPDSSGAATPQAVDTATDLALVQELQRMLREDQANGITLASELDGENGGSDRLAGEPT
jgi:hypothetical protein